MRLEDSICLFSLLVQSPRFISVTRYYTKPKNSRLYFAEHRVERNQFKTHLASAVSCSNLHWSAQCWATTARSSSQVSARMLPALGWPLSPPLAICQNMISLADTSSAQELRHSALLNLFLTRII